MGDFLIQYCTVYVEALPLLFYILEYFSENKLTGFEVLWGMNHTVCCWTNGVY